MLNLLKPEPLFDIDESGQCPADALQAYPGANWAAQDERYMTYLTSRLQSGHHQPDPVLVCATPFGLEVFRRAADWQALLSSDPGATIPYHVVQCSQEALALLIVREYAASPFFNRLDLATIFQDLLSAHSWTHQELGSCLGLSGHTVTNTLRLTKLDPRVKQMLRTKGITVAQAGILLSLPQDTQHKLASEAQLKRWTLKRLTQEVKGDMGALTPSVDRSQGELLAEESPYIKAAQSAIETALPYPSTVTEQDGGGLCLDVRFHSLAELAGIADWLDRKVGAGTGNAGSVTIGPLTREQFDELFAAIVEEF